MGTKDQTMPTARIESDTLMQNLKLLQSVPCLKFLLTDLFSPPEVTVDILLHKPFSNECIYLVFRSLLKEGSWNTHTIFDDFLDQKNSVLENFSSIIFQDIAGQHSQRMFIDSKILISYPISTHSESCKVSELSHFYYKSVFSRAWTSRSLSSLKLTVKHES